MTELSGPFDISHLRRKDLPVPKTPDETREFFQSANSVLALMGEISFFGKKDRQFGGTFNLDQCVGVFVHGTQKEKCILHIPNTVDLQSLTTVLNKIISQVEATAITIAPGEREQFVFSVYNAVQNAIGQDTCSINLLSKPHIEKSSYIASLPSYIMDATTEEIVSVDNKTTDQLVMSEALPTVVGNWPALRMSFASAYRFLNLPYPTNLVLAFNGENFTNYSLQELLHQERRDLYNTLKTTDFKKTGMEEAVEAILIENGITLPNETKKEALNQIIWHFSTLHDSKF